MSYETATQNLEEWCDKVGGEFESGVKIQTGGDRPHATCEFDSGTIEVLGVPDGQEVAKFGVEIDGRFVDSTMIYTDAEDVYTTDGHLYVAQFEGDNDPIRLDAIDREFGRPEERI